MCQTLTVPEKTRTASATAWSMASAWVARRSLLLSLRSVSTPASGASRKVGIWLVKPTTPRRSADPLTR